MSRRKRSSCRVAPDTDVPRSLHALVDAYLRHYTATRAAEFAWYRKIPLGDITRVAAESSTENGGKHLHQRRVPVLSLRALARRLAAVPFNEFEFFAEIHGAVERAAAAVYYVGELACYDVALRIGARFRIEPVRVYLHAGTRKGARALGLPHRAATLGMADLPRELQRLRSWQVEDFLCVYKDELARRGVCRD